MHKIFPFAKQLKQLPAVVFHSWPGTRGEAEAMLRKGINAYFSFGSAALKNHREAIASASVLPADRVLLETDAPYQPLRGKEFSTWRDLSPICSCIASLRKDSGSPCGSPEELKERTAKNFFRVFIR
jgi:TatD DNase family protein